ncbi:GNAT family N-acetyltransferase [Moritella viscosa]|uniref:Phosphinothricin N-acetyltransferase n=1 Tax=Moritella viscosa TaxID=80854 RepID=A0ABY1HJI8_9GAMM|nr:GNAT family N-acetyltransferase [Moritella viscosa]SGY97180.1 Phosphinothricin N-acetyltransferase [Moritella viscosa]SGZ10266.1 Phosphinothricin N-acetyltransferase [Moritella viscosa]SHO27440.1 Phosphinothricin N-acetyltransferase [Moritella viscosa]
MDIRLGELSDVPAITDIFNFYIINTNARFEEQIFSYEDRLEWFQLFKLDSKHQIYVAVENTLVLGFACSQLYRPASAFEDTVEVTVYLDEHAKGKGVGSSLYNRLFTALKKQNVHCALSGIALPNDASIALHKRFGFREIGIFNEYAKKDGYYISSVWLEKQI